MSEIEKKVDLSKVERTSDGRLLSSNANAAVCEHCPNVHINLMDDEGNVFATLLMPPEEIISLGEACKRMLEAGAPLGERTN